LNSIVCWQKLEEQCGIVISNLAIIEGVTTLELREFADELGSVLHMLRADDPDFINFGECYFSEVLPGAIKAWKLHREQTQNLAVPVGRVRLVIYDDRVGSSTRRNLQIQELGRPDAYIRVKIPPGLWYGFACIGHTPALLANCADLPHDPTESDRKPAFDSNIPYDWRF
jgi:dTDP-4-dehydrorhamnose 3,5-epimerase